jgi:hypothetical protein
MMLMMKRRSSRGIKQLNQDLTVITSYIITNINISYKHNQHPGL